MTESRDLPIAPSDGPTSGPPDGIRVLSPSGDDALRAGQVNVVLLRQWGHALGLADVGVAPIDDTTLHGEMQARQAVKRWVEDHHHGNLRYMEAPRLTPRQLLPTAKTVLVALAATERVANEPTTDELVATKATGVIAAYARGLDYHHVLKDKLWQLSQRLCDALGSPLTARVCVDTAPILERYWASCAGVVFVGKSTMAIAPGIGSRVVLGLILLDQDLPSVPQLLDGCGTCTRCLDACPTHAFPAPYVLDAGKCISYLTIENAGAIASELRSDMGSRVFGCDVCQTVCPYNASRKLPAALPELRTTPQRDSANLITWLKLTSGEYRRLTQHSALRRTPRAQLQRNAAVALGNSQKPDSIPELGATLLQNTSPLVRAHAAWALGQLAPLDTEAVRHFLRHALQNEADTSVVQEIEHVLSALAVTTGDASG